MTEQPKDSERTPWDDAFKQLMRETLNSMGLKVIEDPKLGKLPLKADLVIISQEQVSGEWKSHPLWQYLTEQNLLEFKSINDPMQPGDFEVLLAYTLLYRVKFKIGYDSKLSSWLVVSKVNKHLEAALNHYGIELKEISPGFWTSQSIFPLNIVAYSDLPFELPYSTLKLFIKSGKPVQEIFRAVIKSEQRRDWVAAMLTTMELIHPEDTMEVLREMGLAAERKALRETMLELVKDDVEQKVSEEKLKTKRETAQKMKADGIPVSSISKYTGLSEKEIKKL